jgi:hypothetical protein
MRTREQMINAPHHSVRCELLELGMNSTTATMAIPYVWFLPSTSDPYSPVIIMLVEAIQSRLRTMGVRTRGDGFIDARTNHALVQIAGANWKHMPWINVIGFLLASKRRKGKGTAMSGFGSLGDYDQNGYYGSLGLVPTLPWLTSAKGTCTPTNPVTLASFMNLQKQANRVLKTSGKSLLKVDGLLGTKSVAAVNSILGSFHRGCDAIAQRADSLASSIKRKADSAGAPTQVAAPKSTQKPVITTDPATGQQVVNYTRASILPFDLEDPKILAAIGIGGLLLWSAWKQKPKKKVAKRKKPTRRRRLPKQRITRTYY